MCPYNDRMMDNGEVPFIFIAPHLGNRIHFASSHEIVSICFQNQLTDERRDGSAMLSSGIRHLYDWGYPSTYLIELPKGSYSDSAEKIFESNARGGIVRCDEVENPYEEFCRLYLMNQGVDTDGDGLIDREEKKGMVGTNGTIYHSDPEKDDGDEDGLPDREEMGIEYRLEVDQSGNVSLDGSPIYENDSRYLTFAGFGMGNWIIYGVKSDPNDSDSDGDGTKDGEDATPARKNEVMNYILYGPESDFDDLSDEAVIRKRKYESSGVAAEIIPVSSRLDFKTLWDAMGVDGKGKNCFDLNEVVIISHGVNDGTQFYIGLDSEQGYVSASNDRFYSIDELNPKRIETLVLSACNSGTFTNIQHNMAVSFLFSGHTIQKCYGWDGSTKFAKGLVWSHGRFIYQDAYSSEPFYSKAKGEVCFIKIDETTVEYS